MSAHRKRSAGAGDAELVVAALASIGRRGRAMALVSGAEWVLAAALALSTAVIVALGWWGGEVLRALGWVALVSSAAWVLAIAVVVPLRRLSGPEAVARRVGGAAPEIASDLLSASQLAASKRAGLFSQALISRLMGDVLDRLAAVPGRAVFPGRALVAPTAALAVALASAFAARAISPGMVDSGVRTLLSGALLPEPAAEKAIARSPVVGDLNVTLRYPEYLDREERRLSATSGGILAPAGTTVVLEGRSLVEGATRGSAVLSDGSRSDLTIRENGRVVGRFVVSGEGTFTLSVETPSASFEGPERSIEMERDDPPSIRVLEPSGDTVLEEEESLAIEFEAEDDHGLGRVDLVIRGGEQLEARKTVFRAADRVRQLRSGYLWSPQSLRLGEETSLQLELEVYDDDTIRGPKPGRSRLMGVQIMTRRSRHRTALEAQSASLDALVDLLGTRLETPPVSSRHEKRARERFTALRRQTEDVLGRTARLIHILDRDALTGRRTVDAFVQIREDLSNQLLHEARLHREPLAGFRKRQGVDRVTVRLLEDAVIRVDDLILDGQLSRLVTEGDTLASRRSEIADLVEAFDRSRSEAARLALLEAVERMERAVSELHRELESVRGKVEDTYLNPAGTKTIDLLGSLRRLRELLAAGELAAAADLVADMEREIARLMTGLEGGLTAFRTDRFGKGDELLGDLLDRVMDLEADQLQLRRRTVALLRRYQERLVEVMRGRIDPLVRRELARVGVMRAILDEIPTPDEARGEEQLVRLRVVARELELALGQGDLDEARQTAEWMAREAGGWEGGESEAARRVAEVAREAGELGDLLADAYPKPAQLLGERDRQRGRTQAMRQRHLTASTRKLRRWIRDQGDEFRFMAHASSDSLRIAAAHMDGAVSSLEAQQVRDALGEQSAALDELARLREDLKRGNEASPIEGRPVALRGEVRIPDPGDFEVPREFREDIIEAMRGDLPSHYREAIKRYYETLVR